MLASLAAIDPKGAEFADGFSAYLRNCGLIDDGAVQRSLSARTRTGERLETILTRLGLLAENELAKALAGYLSLPIVSREDLPEEPVLAERLTPVFLRNNQILPLGWDGTTLVAAMVDPLAEEQARSISFLLDCDIERRVIAPADFAWAFERLYRQSEEAGSAASLSDGQDVSDLDVQRLRDLASEAPTIKLVNQLLDEAMDVRASDVHVEPFEDSLRVRYRVDGVLVLARTLPLSLRAAVVSRIKIIAQLDIAERRLPQDGRIKTSLRGIEIDLRVSTIPTIYGESVVIRLLDRRAVELTFPSLGFSSATCGALSRLIHEPNGIVLVTGPTGSGKTTTLYAAMSMLNEMRRKIISVEDPIEYYLAGISQIQVHSGIGLDFATALRSILRHDPDVIMVGEIRDLETARTAVQASLTGHLVLSTVHTNSAFATVTRLLDMGIEDYLLGSTLRAVLAQRLVRRLCQRCAEQSPEELANLIAAASRHAVDLTNTPLAPRRPRGCPDCRQTGYAGRVALSELLVVDDQVRQKISTRVDEQELRDAAAGMKTLLTDGLQKAAAGVTTLTEVLITVGSDV